VKNPQDILINKTVTKYNLIIHHDSTHIIRVLANGIISQIGIATASPNLKISSYFNFLESKG